jgi:hypothetical protein
MKIHTSFKMILGTGFHQSKPWAINLLILIFVGLFVMPVAASDPAMTQIGATHAYHQPACDLQVRQLIFIRRDAGLTGLPPDINVARLLE